MSALRHSRPTTRADALVIVARYPEPGAVKTRLGALIGDMQAAHLYRAFLGDLAERFGCTHGAGGDDYDLRWACAPGQRAPEALREIVGATGEIFGQRGDDFAERLYHIACDMRQAGYRRLVIMSSDSPHVTAGAVTDAFAALDAADVALGPAEDGGYYLIALPLTHPHDSRSATAPDLFRGIRMSTATVCVETLERARQLGLSATLLAPTFDVDEAPDLARLWDTLRHADERLAPRTRLALAGLLPRLAPATLLPARDSQIIPAPATGRHSGSEELYDDADIHR